MGLKQVIEGPGSEPGKLTVREHVRAFLRFWLWHFIAAVWLIIGESAEYLHDNFGIVESKVPGYLASVVFGVIGLIRYYQRVAVLYPRDTRRE